MKKGNPHDQKEGTGGEIENIQKVRNIIVEEDSKGGERWMRLKILAEQL